MEVCAVDEIRMLVSGIVMKEGRKIVRVSFQRGRDYAEGILPDGMIEKSGGFNAEEVRKLEDYMRANRKEILGRAKEVDPIRNWLMGG